jgi:energy-coupling factor transport system ATP-binding protein
MTEAKPIIEISNLTFTYGATETPAIKDITLTINEGEYVALMGLNGAGKTTLLMCLNGVVPNMIIGEMEGSVKIGGLDTNEYPTRELAKVVGLVFDNPEFQLSQMSVAEEIALGLENLGIAPEEMRRIIPEVLETVGLSGLESRSPFELSGGQQQRLAIAASLAMHPRVLVMDEPTSNVDPIGKDEIFSVAARLNKERKMTVIMAEHEVEVMAAYADRIIVLDQGSIILNGTPAEVFGHVEQLQAIGLRVPQVTSLAHQLKTQGIIDWPLPLPVVTEEAEAVLTKLLS